MKIYLAGPFFTKEQRINEQKLYDFVTTHSLGLSKEVSFYRPKDYVVKDAASMPNAEWGKRVYDKDVEELDSSDMVIALYYGMDSDTGTAFEIGRAAAVGKPIVVVVMDPRVTVSLMIVNAASAIYFDLQCFCWAWSAIEGARDWSFIISSKRDPETGVPFINQLQQ